MAGLLLAAAALLTVVGCLDVPRVAHESIYADSDPQPDPAADMPHLAVDGSPGAADAVASAMVADPDKRDPAMTPPAGAAYQSVDQTPPDAQQVRVWVDGQQARPTGTAPMLRLAAPVSPAPTLRFELAESVGQLRTIVVQVYKVVADKPDLASGIRMQDDVDLDKKTLTPGRAIQLTRPGGSVALYRVATGDRLDQFTLEAGQTYEIQLLVAGTAGSYSQVVRVTVAGEPLGAPGGAGSGSPPADRPGEPAIVP